MNASKRLAKVILRTVLFSVSLAASAHAATPWLHVTGNWIQDPAGNNVTLRGVAVLPENEAFYCHYCFDQEIPTVIAEASNAADGWYSRVVRITVTKADSLTPAVEFANNIDPLVQAADQRKVRHAISRSSLHLGLWPQGKAIRQSTVMNFWNYVAPRYANVPNAVIFEVFNEPIGLRAGRLGRLIFNRS
jgi:hypothetical protein